MATKAYKVPGIDYDDYFATFLYTYPCALAGVFNFPTTKELWDLFLHDPDTKPILEDWVDERKRLGLLAYRSIQQTSLAGILRNPQFHLVLFAESHPAFSIPGRALGKIDTKTLARFAGAWFVVRLVKAKPSLFPRSQVEPTLLINPYDLLHAWKLLKWVWSITARTLPANPRYKLATRPVFHIPQPTQESPVQTDSAHGTEDESTWQPTAELTPNPIETPEEEEALATAIVNGLGDGTIRVEDTEPIFVEQDESEHDEDVEEGQADNSSEVEKVPISNEYVLDSDADAYDSGYETADECYDIQAELRSRKRAKVTAGQTVHGDVDQSATV